MWISIQLQNICKCSDCLLCKRKIPSLAWKMAYIFNISGLSDEVMLLTLLVLSKHYLKQLSILNFQCESSFSPSLIFLLQI